ncbi:hypothetical protein BHM03_00034423 [Ensete ventricosum]|nr:hypothetical protein BHM03_00034423 [Ensete ventricosum]
MAMSMGMSGSMGAMSASSMGIWVGRNWVSRGRRTGGDVRCAASTGSLTEQYRTLRVQPGASEKEVKKAFRQLALQVLPFSLRFYFSVSFSFGRSDEIASRGKYAVFILQMQYHPDVCKGSNCSVQFHRINKAYDVSIHHSSLC